MRCRPFSAHPASPSSHRFPWLLSPAQLFPLFSISLHLRPGGQREVQKTMPRVKRTVPTLHGEQDSEGGEGMSWMPSGEVFGGFASCMPRILPLAYLPRCRCCRDFRSHRRAPRDGGGVVQGCWRLNTGAPVLALSTSDEGGLQLYIWPFFPAELRKAWVGRGTALARTGEVGVVMLGVGSLRLCGWGQREEQLDL